MSWKEVIDWYWSLNMPGGPAADERVNKVIAVMEEWFQAIEKGIANKRMPDPKGKRYSKEVVDKLIKHIDDFTEHEYTSHPSYFKGMDHPAGFERLKGASREAFVQAIKKVKAEEFQYA